MEKQYLVVSDLHLCDVEEHPDGWKSFKNAKYLFDDELDAMVERFIENASLRTPPTLILNGDIFDFDLVTAAPQDPPWPVAPSERGDGLLPTAEKSAWKLSQIVADHPQFVTTLARFAMRGGSIVYVMGNHDREMHFSMVQQVLVTALQRRTRALGGSMSAEPIRFEPWFYYVPGQIYAEHGQQYDFYSSFRYVLSPVVPTPEGPVIALPMGNLSNRYLMNRMGFFNPHASDFVLNVFHYFAHWLKYYAFSRHSIVVGWLWGSLRVMYRLLALKKKIHERPASYDSLMYDTAKRAGLPLKVVHALSKMERPPITTKFYRIVREFWLDRLLMAVLMTVGTFALALMPVPLWVKLMVPLSSFPLLFFIYEWFAQGETIFTIEKEIPSYAQRIAKLLDVKVVTFGHTHRPRILPLERNRWFADTGTWAPMVTNGEHAAGKLAGYHNFLVLTFSGNDVRLDLNAWMNEPEPEPVAEEVKLAS